ncbi:MAG: hypothetical protein ACI9OU_000757 [Candidatus Promineifilaceae bacterium]|jgi:hypothetical protein
MNTQFNDFVTQLIAHWERAAPARVVVGVIGAVIIAITLRARSRGKVSGPITCLWVLLGAVVILFASNPQNFITTVISTDYLTRVRIMMGFLSLLVLLITWETVRSTHLKERYALLWVATAVIVLVCALFPQAVDLFRAVAGMSYVMAVVSVMFTFLLLVAFHFSITMSSMELKQSKTAQRIAILEARLLEVENALSEKTDNAT